MKQSEDENRELFFFSSSIASGMIRTRGGEWAYIIDAYIQKSSNFAKEITDELIEEVINKLSEQAELQPFKTFSPRFYYCEGREVSKKILTVYAKENDIDLFELYQSHRINNNQNKVIKIIHDNPIVLLLKIPYVSIEKDTETATRLASILEILKYRYPGKYFSLTPFSYREKGSTTESVLESLIATEK